MTDVLVGAAVGLEELPGLKFDPACAHTYCGICGAVFQSDIDRNPHGYINASFDYNLQLVLVYAEGKRREWSLSHAETHPPKEHFFLRISGEQVTPEAAHKLAAFGIIPITDDEEVNSALLESSPIPINDAEE